MHFKKGFLVIEMLPMETFLITIVSLSFYSR